jgi:hypothetical protein
MATFDLQVYIQERLRAFDESMDVAPGSPVDIQVIQPMLRRLGTDPFTVDLAVFLSDRLKQAFPEMATDEGDAITDLLIKPALLLWDPIVREIFRVRSCQSFKDPQALTTDEADALGANLFSDRERGDFARGTGRLYYAQPRSVSVTPVNFFTSRSGLHFFPDGQQNITVNEMLLNISGSLYYFDVNLIAEAAGTAYNIEANELINVANLEGTMQVKNLRRFRSGQKEETASEYIDRAQQELTERSMVTLRGLGARIPKAFPEVTRLAAVGFGDPEMQRDVLTGGGLGAIVGAGLAGTTVLDLENKALTRRFHILDSGVDLYGLLDTDALSTYVLTVFNAFAATPAVRDLTVRRLVDSTTIEVEEQVLQPFGTGKSWMLRKKELTLSGIPGGILFPDSAAGTVSIPEGEVHVGGHYDVSVRGSDFDTSTLVLENISDASPAASGELLTCTAVGEATLTDLVLGTSYAVGDATYTALADAKQYGFTLQVLTGVNAGNYRVLEVVQSTGTSPVLTLDTSTPIIPGTYKWRLVDVIDIDLVEPKDTRVSGGDLQSVQNLDVLSTASSTDLMALGVSVEDTLRIESGADASDYTVKGLPAFNAVQVDRALTATASNLKYTIFKANTAGGVQRPFVRVTRLELLDTSGQPVGSVVPYAHPIDIQSRSFENPGRGVKVDVTDGRLGILTLKQPVGGFAVGGQTLIFHFSTYSDLTVTFSSGNKTYAQVVSEVNNAALFHIGVTAVLATPVFDGDEYRVGIVPVSPLVRVSGGSSMTALFGSAEERSTRDIQSDSLPLGGWSAVTPSIDQDGLDAVQVLDGLQIGYYGDLSVGATATAPLLAGSVSSSRSVPAFAPEAGRHLQVGARSIGSVRCYFLEPTSIEFGRYSFFTATLTDGAVVRFYPDPTLDFAKLPAYPATALIKDGASTALSTTFTSASQNFVLSSVVEGDKLDILYIPRAGSTALGTSTVTSVAVANKQFVLSIDGRADQTITFANDSTSIAPTHVTRDGVVSQINSATGRSIAKLTSTYHLELEGDTSIIVRGSSASTSANPILGFGTVDVKNRADNAGTYTVAAVSENALEVHPAFLVTEAREAFSVRRPGTQRVCSTQMSAQTAMAGLYYCDVELVSEGTGDIFNIDSGMQLTAVGYRSDGYYLTTADSNLTFSTVEQLSLHVSRSILEVGVADDPANATQLTGQSLELTYDRSTLVADVQNFATSETERVVCSNPLSRHLVPHFVRFDFGYVGGSSADLVTADMVTYIKDLFPQDYLEVGDLTNLAYQRGATGVDNPIDLIAIVHNYDRTVWAQRSQNALNTGRLAAFIADVVTVNRRSG